MQDAIGEKGGSARTLEETECDVRYVFYVYAASCDTFFYRASSGCRAPGLCSTLRRWSYMVVLNNVGGFNPVRFSPEALTLTSRPRNMT